MEQKCCDKIMELKFQGNVVNVYYCSECGKQIIIDTEGKGPKEWLEEAGK